MTTQLYVWLPPPNEPGAYREAYPYGPSATSFNADLGVEISAGARADSPALAVVPGLVRVLPGDQALSEVSLILKPTPSITNGLTTLFDGGVPVFVYRNIELSSVREALQAEILEFPSSEPLANRVDRFLTGQFAVFVGGGEELGLAGTSTDWARIGFEIALVPNGLAGEPGWKRLQELLAPSSTSRRVDPLSVYNSVSNDSNVTIAPSHEEHPLLSLLTERVLLEVRNEYDEPFKGDLKVTTSSGTVEYPFTALNRGTVDLTTTGESPETERNFMVSNSKFVFTPLPSGSSAKQQPSANLSPPSHWALQGIFMADVNDERNWFVKNEPPLARYTEHNRVEYLIDGLETFEAMDEAMQTVTGSGHYLRLAGWWLTDNFDIVEGQANTSIKYHTEQMDKNGAEVRMMLWNQKSPLLQNNSEVKRVNQLPGGNGRAILDDKVLPMGSHHQKLMVINGNSGAVAFCGGVDINPDRVDDQHHQKPAPYHDVHTKIEGPAVGELNTTFVQRWNGHPKVGPGQTHKRLPTDERHFDPTAGSSYVQVSRTYAPRQGYRFAPRGDLTTLKAVRNAIKKARRYIYLEDQYAWPYSGPYPFDPSKDTVGILTDLLNVLNQPDFEYLLIVFTHNTETIGGQDRFRRHQFIRPLRDAHPDKVFVYYLERPGTGAPSPGISTAEAYHHLMTPELDGGSSGVSYSGGPAHPNEIYVHSKVWIIDDVYVKIGSSNCNRRSFTHDTEADIHVIDEQLQQGGRKFTRSFRTELWAEHLNIRGPKRHILTDPTNALHYWQNPPRGAHVRRYDETLPPQGVGEGGAWGGGENPDGFWNNFVDPDGR